MYYGELKDCDIANGSGIRISLFVSGCRNHCKGCFQPQTWDFCYGKAFTEETQQRILDMLAPSYVDGLSLLGGDPMEPENQKELLPFLKRVKERYPDKNIWIYTGYVYEKLLSGEGHPCSPETPEILAVTDILVDGPFVEELRDITLRFRGSQNQRLIDLNATRQTGELVFLKDRKRSGDIYKT